MEEMTAITVELTSAGSYSALGVGSTVVAGCVWCFQESRDASCNTCDSAWITDYEFEVYAHPAEKSSRHVENRLISDVDVLGIQTTLDPLRQFLVFSWPCESAIC